MVDKKRIEAAVTEILAAIGEDVNRPGIKDTPKRVAKAYEYIFSGLEEEAEEHLEKRFECEQAGVVIQKDIEFYSMCEHHLLPFFGKVHIAYVPNEEVVGLSKLARTVEVYARRPQLQEQLGAQIANAIYEQLKCSGVMVVIEASHMCMSMRGVQKQNAITTTICKRGIFKADNGLCTEVLTMIK